MKSTNKTPGEQVVIFSDILKRHLDALYAEAQPLATDESAVGRLLGMVAHKSLSAGFFSMQSGYGLPTATDWLTTVLQGFSMEAVARHRLKLKITVAVVEA